MPGEIESQLAFVSLLAFIFIAYLIIKYAVRAGMRQRPTEHLPSYAGRVRARDMNYDASVAEDELRRRNRINTSAPDDGGPGRFRVTGVDGRRRRTSVGTFKPPVWTMPG